MSSQLIFLCLTFVGVSLGAAVGEKREMPASQGYGGGVGTSAYTGYEGYTGPMVATSQQAPPGYGGSVQTPPMPQYGPSPYTNPGFSVQTGFEGFLVR